MCVFGGEGADFFGGAEVEVEVEAGVEGGVGVVGGDGERCFFVGSEAKVEVRSVVLGGIAGERRGGIGIAEYRGLPTAAFGLRSR